MRTSLSAMYCGRTQPSSSGTVMPLSWSSTTAGSSAEGSLVDSDGVGVGVRLVGAKVGVMDSVTVVLSSAPSSSRRTNASVTIAATRTAPAVARAMAFARPGASPPGGRPGTAGTGGGPTGAGSRRCSVQAVPSHQRSSCG
ncbi:hypothetical protein QF037_007516 [Streptomyces canus]|nr:hypothetical protein [Streptomyces canus]